MLTRRSRLLALPCLGALALLLALAPSCASSGSNGESDGDRPGIAGSWVLESLPDAPLVDLGAGEEPPTLEVDAEGAISGFAGVNRFQGRFDAAALAEGALSMQPLATTRAAGPPAAMELEDAFLATLSSADGFRREGANLFLTQGDRVVAHLGHAGF